MNFILLTLLVNRINIDNLDFQENELISSVKELTEEIKKLRKEIRKRFPEAAPCSRPVEREMGAGVEKVVSVLNICFIILLLLASAIISFIFLI